MDATENKVIRIGYEWRIVEQATGHTVTAGVRRIAASSKWQTHDGLLESGRAGLRCGRIFRTEIVRHWVEM